MKRSRTSTSHQQILRVLDANYNRAKEALRVIEDIFRFVVQDSKLTARWKRCRHHLTQALMRLPISYQAMVQSRQSDEDVGRRSFVRDKKTKVGYRDLFIANVKRSQEALRVLEEFTKMVKTHEAIRFQRLRFRVYELEKNSLSKF